MRHVNFLTTLAVALATLASCGNEPAMKLHNDSSPGKTALLETKDQALVTKAVKARDFFYSKGSRVSAAGATIGHYVTNSSRSATDTVLSVVNFADGQGFVILTDKTDSPEILAVSDEGTLNLENIDNPSLKLFVDNAVENLQGRSGDIIERPQKPLMYIIEDTYDTIYNIEPMIKVRWGQDKSPYNLYCPIINGKRTPAGCGPIAVAQVMTHYQYPQSFVWDVNGAASNIALDWTEINKHITSGVGAFPPVCTANNPNATHDVIGKLVRQIGKKMNAEYTVSGTTTSFDKAQTALNQYGYTTTISNVSNNASNIMFDGSSIWIVCATDPVKDSVYGHVFVVDGRKYIKRHYLGYIVDPNVTPPVIREIVQDSISYFDYVHINWGWDGTSNGYFYNGSYKTDSATSLDNPNDGTLSWNFTTRFCYIKAHR